MNTLITELWERAAQEVPVDSWSDTERFMAKFASLIIDECMHVGDNAMQDGKWPSEKMKLHFGIEE